MVISVSGVSAWAGHQRRNVQALNVFFPQGIRPSSLQGTAACMQSAPIQKSREGGTGQRAMKGVIERLTPRKERLIN
jgi:hypothetical protein